ncbi:MAG: Eco57I restriction-modification methylase domain-containing protein [Anaerolineaceae bacterium]|nr:Eco57I restriction-modification methylase domain-containing protein [Anaerolineaceae bacterium]
MDNRPLLQSLTKKFTRQKFIAFLRNACGSFRPQSDDLSHLLKEDDPVEDLVKLGEINFDNDGRRLILLASQSQRGLTTQSGKLKQFNIARRVLGSDYDAGIFAFHDTAGNFRFSLITYNYQGTKRGINDYRRYTYFISPDLPAHTFINQIGKADFSSIESILEAFNVEPVTKEFYREYEKIFREAEATITLDWSAEQKRLYTQRFFNRLMFLIFLERKGWMKFTPPGESSPQQNYLRALFVDYVHHDANKTTANFHRSRLNTLFFWGLNNPRGDKRDDSDYIEIQRRIGDVPYLNGGLFEEEGDDQSWFFSDQIVGRILTDLICHFNFTVTESTPIDVEVAVDPEMLGKIFEELVTGRHESGSYYTPKPVVAFMCREALKGYLATGLPEETDTAIAQFVDENAPGDLRNPEKALITLRAVKVCDPACGSGAYLLGMLHQLLDLRQCLFARHSNDMQLTYDRKLEIIQNNLYGVDKDVFAVNIARLRLWLSLIVDFEGDNPPPLPNLDFKIEAGDSLTSPDPSGGLQPDMFRINQVQEFLRLKNDYMNSHHGKARKGEIAAEIEELRVSIREWAYPKDSNLANDSFDWQVNFAEIFAPALAESTLSGKMTGIVNTSGGQMELTQPPKQGGFDIVLANPPYVRQELLGDLKQDLRRLYPEVYNGMADLYVYFFARAHQLLRQNGVACFISSNKWLRAGYGEKLRQYLLDKQAFLMVADFGELPVFQTAATFPAIFLWKKQDRGFAPTKWAPIKDLP